MPFQPGPRALGKSTHHSVLRVQLVTEKLPGKRDSAALPVYWPEEFTYCYRTFCVRGVKMASPMVVWMSVAGVVFLAMGAMVAGRDVADAHGLDKLIALGCVFFAAPLGVFGVEHLTNAGEIAQLVPSWMPGHLFWAYFVGVALVAAG